jgi:cytoskeletal protein CcmA (bactofilin family)
VKTSNLKLSASSAGDIKLEVYAQNIDINGSSAGDITLSGEVDMLDASLSSAGDLNAFNLKTREADITASSSGDADIFVTEKLRARASSAGDVNYKGEPKNVDAHSSSAGGVHKK